VVRTFLHVKIFKKAVNALSINPKEDAMSWFTKVSFFSALLCVSLAQAGRVYFPGQSVTDGLNARLVDDRATMGSVELRFSIPHIDVNRMTDGFDKIAAPGLVPLEVAGLPELFSTGSLVAVPVGFEPQVEMVSREDQELENVSVQPAQAKYRCDCDENKQFSFNTAAYRSSGLYPAKQLVLEEVGRIQGVRLVRVGFYPAQYNFAKRTLKVTHKADIRVSFRQLTDSVQTMKLTKPMFSMLRSVTANGASLNRDVVRVESQETMLIVSGDQLVDGMKPFVEWKQRKGMKVDLVSFTAAGGTKEKVKEYIRNYYEKSAVKPSYLLFVGNKDSMPGYMESTASGSAATDFTYAVIKADDKLPSLPYGRFLANNLDELKLEVTRAIDYEASPERGAEWYQSAMTIASDEGSNPSDKDYAIEIQDALKAHTYTKTDSFFQGDDNATAKNISEALKEGRSWISYFGHGSGTSWGSTNDTFGNAQVAKLENANRLPVIIDVACQNASWVKLDKNFGKAWVTQSVKGANAGAVAFYGGSVNISWHPPAIMSVGIAKSHFEKPVYHLGGTVMAGQLYLLEKKGVSSETMDNFKWYNLFGDPSMTVRTSIPKAYAIKSALMENDNRDLVITVRATDINGAPVADVQTSLTSSSNQMLANAKTGVDGSAQLVLSGLTKIEPGTLLTTTGYNLESQSHALQVR